MTSPWQPPDQTPPTAAAPVPPVQPRYGELAPPGYVSPVPSAETQAPVAPTYYAAAPVERKTRTADVAVTCVLLALGLIGMLIGLLTPLGLSRSLANEYARYGLTYRPSASLGAQGAAIAISSVVLYLVALGVSILLLVRRRLAFWVPLVAGAVAAIIFWGILLSIVMSDSRLMDALAAANR